MTPQLLLQHIDSGEPWPAQAAAGTDLAGAYQTALAVRALRLSRCEVPRGFKIGFTNSGIWPRYNVFAPIWGTVWESTLNDCDDLSMGVVSLDHTCQPRIEPETVFGLRATPPAGATLTQLFDALDWVAPGFEVVQSHQPDWKFQAADTVADSGLHARLLVGKRRPIGEVATDAASVEAALALASVRLFKDSKLIDHGKGANVLGSPLRALHHFLTELRQCPGAPDLKAGDVVTTGTWTDAWPVAVGERWTAQFDAPLSTLQIRFS